MAIILVMIYKIILVVCFWIQSANICNSFIGIVIFWVIHVDTDEAWRIWNLLCDTLIARISVHIIKILRVVFRVIFLFFNILLVLNFSIIVLSGLNLPFIKLCIKFSTIIRNHFIILMSRKVIIDFIELSTTLLTSKLFLTLSLIKSLVVCKLVVLGVWYWLIFFGLVDHLGLRKHSLGYRHNLINCCWSGLVH